MNKQLQLPTIGMGMWAYGGGLSPDHTKDDVEVAALQNAFEIGYRHFDTAEMYASGHSEELLGLALKDYERDDFIITSKVNKENLAYDDLLAACDRSLKYLQTSYIDLYLIHWPNPAIPLEESFRALNQLVDSGKIRRIGVSNFDLPLLEHAVALSETPLFGDQVHYSLLFRRPQHDGTLDFCRENDMVLTAYWPLKDGSGRSAQSGAALNNQVVIEIADRISATPAQVAINWLARQPNVVTIPKSSNEQRQQENLAAGDIVMSEEDVDKLDGLAT